MSGPFQGFQFVLTGVVHSGLQVTRDGHVTSEETADCLQTDYDSVHICVVHS